MSVLLPTGVGFSFGRNANISLSFCPGAKHPQSGAKCLLYCPPVSFLRRFLLEVFYCRLRMFIRSKGNSLAPESGAMRCACFLGVKYPQYCIIQLVGRRPNVYLVIGEFFFVQARSGFYLVERRAFSSP